MTRPSVIGLAVAALALVHAPPDVTAQGRSRLGGAGSIGLLELRGAPDAAGSLRGTALGVEGSLDLGWITAEVRYLEARFDAAAERVLVQGSALAGVRLARWLTVLAGPEVRSHVLTNSTIQTVAWLGRLRFGASLVPDLVVTHADLWRVMTARHNGLDPWSGGFGGEAGLTVLVPDKPLWARLAYRIDRGEFAGPRREVAQTLSLAVGIRAF